METEMIIRPYQAGDREAVRRICCDTGFLGKPIDPVFQDRELFADFLTAYYTDVEPETSVILECGGEIKGYVLGSRYPQKQSAYNRRQMPGRMAGLIRRFLFSYNAASRRYVFWLVTRGWREVPFTPKGMAHFHINLVPEARNVAQTRSLIDFFLDGLTRAGEKAVYGQMVTFEKRRGERMFARYGFVVRDIVEVTKYRRFVDTPVFLFTVVKDLASGASLYSNDLRAQIGD